MTAWQLWLVGLSPAAAPRSVLTQPPMTSLQCAACTGVGSPGAAVGKARARVTIHKVASRTRKSAALGSRTSRSRAKDIWPPAAGLEGFQGALSRSK
jgi:hypothetical protein